MIPLSWTFDHVGPLTRNATDAAIILRTIAGYDPLDVASRPMKIPEYVAGSLRSKVAPLRVGVAREFFFADLDPDIEAATGEGLRVLQKLTDDLHEVRLPASGAEELRAAVRAAEAYTYHADFIREEPRGLPA